MPAWPRSSTRSSRSTSTSSSLVTWGSRSSTSSRPTTTPTTSRGNGKLAAATGAKIHINRAAGAEYEHEPFGDGFELELGALAVRAIHTPGHRPEHTAFALVDRSRGEEPWALLSGDSLFVNDVARPDLAIDKEEGAQAIFRSLHERILSLPPETEVWPGHLGGSLCGGPAMDMKPSSTLAYERAHNPMLQVDDEQEFVAQAVGSLGPQPPNFEAIVALNRGELLTEGVEVMPLTPRQVEHKRSQGALLVDVRTDLQFDDAHIPRAIAIPAVQAGFGTRLAWLADRDQEIVLVGRDDGDARRAAKLALSVGIRRFGGFLHGGMTEWRREQRPVERIERLELDDLAGRLESEPQTHRRVEVRLADRSDCRSTPSTCSWLTPARPPPPSCSAPPPALGRVTPRANWRATWRASREVPAHRRCLFGLQNRQGVAVPRLDGSIPSPLRRAKGLHLHRFSGEIQLACADARYRWRGAGNRTERVVSGAQLARARARDLRGRLIVATASCMRPAACQPHPSSLNPSPLPIRANALKIAGGGLTTRISAGYFPKSMAA